MVVTHSTSRLFLYANNLDYTYYVVTLVVLRCVVECTVEADDVQGKCHVVFGEEIDDLDSYFLEKPDVFWFSEVATNYYCIY